MNGRYEDMFGTNISNKETAKTVENKLGQHHSQTPLSSAFWVQKDFGLKKYWVKKN